MNGPVPTVSLVVYAKDREGLARFYAALLGLQEVESGPGFTLLAARGVELAVVGIRADIAARIELSSPPVVREDTPLKFSFLVASLAAAARGRTMPGPTVGTRLAAWASTR